MTDAPDRGRLRLDHWIAAGLMFAMAAIAFANVLSRYLFRFSIAATEEITIHLFVWVTVVGSGLAFERGGQLGMVTLLRVLPARCRQAAILVSALLSAGLFVVVDVYTIQAIYDEVTLFQARSAALDVPVWIYYAGVPVLSVCVFAGIWRQAAAQLHGPPQAEEGSGVQDGAAAGGAARLPDRPAAEQGNRPQEGAADAGEARRRNRQEAVAAARRRRPSTMADGAEAQRSAEESD